MAAPAGYAPAPSASKAGTLLLRHRALRLVRPVGYDPTTNRLKAGCSTSLSYERLKFKIGSKQGAFYLIVLGGAQPQSGRTLAALVDGNPIALAILRAVYQKEFNLTYVIARCLGVPVVTFSIKLHTPGNGI